MRREDITVEDVIRLWLREGQSMLAISLQYNTSLATVRRRLATAREDHPELPWEERKLQQSQAYRSSNQEYVQMNDGKAGQPELRGSVIRGRRNRPVL